MRIIVGSRNPVKVKAVEKAFAMFFREKIEVLSTVVKTSVGNQPIGMKNVIRGSVERAKGAKDKFDSDFGIGIEAGLIRIPGTITGFMDFQVCAIIDKEDFVTIGFGPGFEFPPKAIDAVINNEVSEIEEILSKMSGITNIGDNIGGIGWLTKSIIDREQLSFIAVVMAIIPRVNIDLYKGRFKKYSQIIKEI